MSNGLTSKLTVGLHDIFLEIFKAVARGLEIMLAKFHDNRMINV